MEALGDLIFWIIVLISLFVLFRWRQARKDKNQDDKD